MFSLFERYGGRDKRAAVTAIVDITVLYRMRVLITVGSTRFDALVGAAFSRPVLNALAQKGYSDVVIQCGNSPVEEFSVRGHGVNINVWTFKPSLDEDYDAADLVIGHAGLCFLRVFSIRPKKLRGLSLQAQGPYSMYCEGANLS
jgi:hypothetical protein